MNSLMKRIFDKSAVCWLMLLLMIPLPALSCTVVIAWQGDRVIVGNNEDWFDTNAKYWYEPARKNESYGSVFFGFKKDGKFAQGGMNEKGLFFDGLYIDKVKLKKETRFGKKAAPTHVFKKMLHEAATVEEALEYLSHFFIPFIKSAQMVIADQHGDYAVINVNGVTRRKLPKEQYVVISNFPAENITPGAEQLPEYHTACELLESNQPYSVDLITQVLDVTHQQGEVKSVYSNVFDLTSLKIYNYYLYDYGHSHVIDLTDISDLPADAVYFKEIFAERPGQLGID